ncbi:MAG: glycosyltransferase family 39 protein [Phycisphaerae bacterium]|nr:glycosyltransferase family 39 protein [Phycisphaerae bacterium]
MTKSRKKPTRAQSRSTIHRQTATSATDGGKPSASRHNKSLGLLATAAVPVLFVVFVWWWHPFHDVSEFDPDEGNNVIKALMLAKGHTLYAEIWSDQPPLFTYMLRGWFALTDWTVHQGRLLVLLCGAVLLWALYETVRFSWGRLAGLASAFLLMTSYRYMALSVSVMLALPTLMFAMLSIYALAQYRRRHRAGWMLASGGFVVLSLFTKMFTLVAAPLIFLAVLGIAWQARRDEQRKGHWLMPVVLFCAGAVVVGAVVFLATIPPGDFMQLIQPHLAAEKEMSAPGFDKFFWDMVKFDYAFALLGIAGLLQIIRKRQWFSLLPVGWGLLAYASLYSHRPLWYHHYPLLGVPLCWAAGIAVGALFSLELWRGLLPWRGLRSAYAALIVLSTVVFLVLAAVHIPAKFEREYEYAKPYTTMTTRDRYTVAVLKQFAELTDYIVADRQILPFNAGMIVPPELSVTSVKRMRTGSLSMEALIDLLEQYKPGVIHLCWRNRIRMTRELLHYLDENYSRLYVVDPYGNRKYDRCYVRGTLDVDLLKILESASAEFPDLWEGHYNVASQLAKTGRHEEAVRRFESSLAIRPTIGIYRGLGNSLKQLKRYDKAAKVYDIIARNLERMGGRQEEVDRARQEAQRLHGLVN